MNDPDHVQAARGLDRAVALALEHQVLDSGRVDHGGYFSDDLGFASPSHVGNARFIMNLGLAYGSTCSSYHADRKILDRLLFALDFQKRCRRPSGFLDIPFTNFDSPPDTAFAVSMIARAAWMARSEPGLPGRDDLEEAFRSYLVPSARSVASGGFHTPNHRWVIVAALSQTGELYPELDAAETIRRYLKEGVDVNKDGQFSERSSGGYDSVCDQHLILASLALGDRELLAPVRGNLRYLLRLLHGDLSVVTSISLRQDRARKVVPVQAADSFYFMARIDDDPEFGAAAKALLEKCGFDNPNLVYYMSRHPAWLSRPLPATRMPDDFSLLMEQSGIWRVRRGMMSATVATGVSSCFSVAHGGVDLSSVRLHCPYFAGARFKGTSLCREAEGVRLQLASEFLLPQLPGYWLPLGRNVDPADLPYKRLEDRSVIPRPQFVFSVLIREMDRGFTVDLETLDGMPGVPFVVEFLFTVPGRIETDQASFAASANQTIVLKAGHLTYHNGGHAITIGQGFFAHRNVDPPGIEAYDGFCRVVMSDWTPVKRSFTIHCGTYLESEGRCYSGKGPVSLSGTQGTPK